MNKQNISTELNFDASFYNNLQKYYVQHNGDRLTSPKLIVFNQNLAEEIGLCNDLDSEQLAHLLTGSVNADGSRPIAQVYAGHQFGGFSPQLGDGRAILLGEIIDINGHRRDIHLKGSGQTPFSRGGDGKAAIGPVLREYLLGEAMHALGVPTTRGLAACLTGEQVMREKLLPGAVVARVAKSHIRVGTFQYFAARGDQEQVKLLADYTINRHYPGLLEADNPYIELLKIVRNNQAKLITQWMTIGFVHGVMNTDNVTVTGETIDFGPCAFMDKFDNNAVFSSIDRQGRYAYGNQPYMAQWNIARFAETLLPLLHENNEKAIEIATAEVQNFTPIYHQEWLNKMIQKIGLLKAENDDSDLINGLFEILQNDKVDFTLFFRGLSQSLSGGLDELYASFDNAEKFKNWYKLWKQRLTLEGQEAEDIISAMNAANPLYIPRNHLVEDVLQAAERDNNLKPFEELLSVVTSPFKQRTGLERFEKPAPKEFGPYKTFCGT